jgi:metal-responsive CopG/Arc/MetJ family transcriptional regulator
MTTIQVVLDDELLKAADRAARRSKKNRSELMREALRQYLRNKEIRAMEEQERIGYTKHPQAKEELQWVGEASWPAE